MTSKSREVRIMPATNRQQIPQFSKAIMLVFVLWLGMVPFISAMGRQRQEDV